MGGCGAACREGGHGGEGTAGEVVGSNQGVGKAAGETVLKEGEESKGWYCISLRNWQSERKSKLIGKRNVLKIPGKNPPTSGGRRGEISSSKN